MMSVARRLGNEESRRRRRRAQIAMSTVKRRISATPARTGFGSPKLEHFAINPAAVATRRRPEIKRAT